MIEGCVVATVALASVDVVMMLMYYSMNFSGKADLMAAAVQTFGEQTADDFLTAVRGVCTPNERPDALWTIVRPPLLINPSPGT